MPRGDRTGPYGKGPRGGVCARAGASRFFGHGGGRGMGWRAGRGYSVNYPVNAEAEREALEFRAKELERELAVLKSRLEENSGNTEG